MTFTKQAMASLKIHTKDSKAARKHDLGDVLHKCSKCSFASKYKTSTNRHEKNIHN